MFWLAGIALVCLFEGFWVFLGLALISLGVVLTFEGVFVGLLGFFYGLALAPLCILSV